MPTTAIHLVAEQPTELGRVSNTTATNIVARVVDWSDPAITITLALQVSTDGTTWRTICQAGPEPGARQPYKGSSDLRLGYIGVWKMCSCGEPYIPGHPANARLLAHSDLALQAGRTLAQLRALLETRFQNITLAQIKTWIVRRADGTDIDDTWITRTFHTPDSQDATVSRFIRLLGLASGGDVDSTLTYVLT